jgi:hypothetical protein
MSSHTIIRAFPVKWYFTPQQDGLSSPSLICNNSIHQWSFPYFLFGGGGGHLQETSNRLFPNFIHWWPLCLAKSSTRPHS